MAVRFIHDSRRQNIDTFSIAEPFDSVNRTRPTWDRNLKKLCLGKRLIKEYRQPSPNLWAILDAFDERSWPTRIDDPLPTQPEGDEWSAKQRLHETIHNLNRGMSRGTIRFGGDGTGRGVVWHAGPRKRKRKRRQPSGERKATPKRT